MAMAMYLRLSFKYSVADDELNPPAGTLRLSIWLLYLDFYALSLVLNI
jgi:hypothetical protein